MSSALVIVMCLAMGQTTPGDAPPLATANLRAQVSRLVEQLNSNEQAKRVAAEQELIRLGPDVLPLLPATSARTPAEVQNRLLRVRTALMKVEVEAVTRPSIVTLAGEMPVSKAIQEIARQTGNKLVDYRERFGQQGADPTIKVSLEKTSFWEALDTVLDAASLTIYNYDEEKGALAYTSRSETAAPRLGRGSYGGLFRLEPTRIEATRDLRTGTRALKLTVDAVWEPRVQPIVLEVPLAEVKAADERGGVIEVDRSEGTLEVPVESSNAAVEIELPLVAPPRSVARLASVKGRLTAVVLGKVESFEFADIDKARSAVLERGGATVTVDHCRKNGDIFDVSIRVRFDRAAGALQSHRGWIYENECYLIDEKGGRIDNVGLEATGLAANEVGLAYKFDLGQKTSPAGYKFVYRTAADIIRIPVEFELREIDLP